MTGEIAAGRPAPSAQRPAAKPSQALADQALAEAFLFAEARLLDERRFRDWMGLFAEDGTYWVPAAAGQDSPFTQASLFYDDRELMKTRIERLEHPRIHVQTPPSRTAHLIGNVVLDHADAAAGEYVVTSTVIMVEYRDDTQRLFAGRQTHRLRRTAGGLRIVQKRVDLVNCDSAFEPIAVPI
jgi:3-phenylpropionate/cinnamic acid dioxygenase small subunit